MGVSNPNLFVVSGDPESGKTTVLHELASLGFARAPEVARQIIREQAQSGGTALPWRDREAYTRLMLQRSIRIIPDTHPPHRAPCSLTEGFRTTSATLS